jgi:hypothetical protein
VNEDELKEFLGPVGYSEYEKAPDWDRPKIVTWCQEVAAMSDAEFTMETSSRILDDAIMTRSRGNNYGFYARTTGCYQEAKRRHVKAGHTEECRGETLYSVGHGRAMRSQGHTPSEPYLCDCGKGEK